MKQNVTEKLNEALNVDASSQEVVVKEDVIFEKSLLSNCFFICLSFYITKYIDFTCLI